MGGRGRRLDGRNARDDDGRTTAQNKMGPRVPFSPREGTPARHFPCWLLQPARNATHPRHTHPVGGTHAPSSISRWHRVCLLPPREGASTRHFPLLASFSRRGTRHITHPLGRHSRADHDGHRVCFRLLPPREGAINDALHPPPAYFSWHRTRPIPTTTHQFERAISTTASMFKPTVTARVPLVPPHEGVTQRSTSPLGNWRGTRHHHPHPHPPFLGTTDGRTKRTATRGARERQQARVPFPPILHRTPAAELRLTRS